MFARQMVRYSDAQYQGISVFRSLIGLWTGIQMLPNMVMGIWIASYLNNEQVKICYSDFYAI